MRENDRTMEREPVPESPAEAAGVAGVPGGAKFAAWEAYRWAKDPLAFYQDRFAEYGDPFRMPFFFGTNYVVTHDPATIREIIRAEQDTFGSDPADKISIAFGDTSVITTAGAQHRRYRKLLMPPLHGARMRSYSKVIRSATLEHAKQWRTGEPFVMQHEAEELTLELILRTIFGVVDAEPIARFRPTIREMTAACNPILVVLPSSRVDLGKWSPWGRFQRAKGALDALIYEEIRQRKQMDLSKREDILSLLIAARDEEGEPLSDVELRDQLVSLFIAGHETTATAIAWAFYWLHSQPAILERLLAELGALGDDPDPEAFTKVPYLDALCQEVLRIHPIVVHVERYLARPFKVGRYEVPPGYRLSIAVIAAHYRPDVYPEPHVFRPERFLERKFGPHEYLPFGLGDRYCLGAAFSLFEMKIVIATLVTKYRLRLVSDKVVKPYLRNITRGPREGIPMISEGLRSRD